MATDDGTYQEIVEEFGDTGDFKGAIRRFNREIIPSQGDLSSSNRRYNKSVFGNFLVSRHRESHSRSKEWLERYLERTGHELGFEEPYMLGYLQRREDEGEEKSRENEKRIAAAEKLLSQLEGK